MGGFKEYWDLTRKYPKYQGGFIWDFVDQSIHWTNADGIKIYGYGGDFNRYDASDWNFCDNGLIGPDRIPNPHMDEVAYFYQSIWATAGDLSKGEVNVFNEYFFRSLSGYYAEWQILADGEVLQTGQISNLDIAPQQTGKINIAYDKTELPADKELLLNVLFKLKKAETLLPAGHVASRNQMVIKPYEASKLELTNQEDCKICPVNQPVVKDYDLNYLIISNDKFHIEFNKHNGYLDKYIVDGTQMITREGSLAPNFWRAPTDNDYGAQLQTKYSAWKNPEMK